MDLSDLERQGANLVHKLASGCMDNNIGSATVAIYDTAWLSMVAREVGGQHRWQFPECFRYLLNTQEVDGLWSTGQSLEDQILNTMAALITMIKHANSLTPDAEVDEEDLNDRIDRATASLQSRLQEWDVESSMHVGFELLVPAMTEMLESSGHLFSFPGSLALQKLNERKLSGFVPETIYKSPTPFLHSLEAFIGKIDFDQVRCHRISGSMLASPASTAAYLMHASVWDDEAEIYLREVILKGYGHGNGGVPSVFPISIFETTWAISTLIQGGFIAESLGQQNIDRISGYLQYHLRVQDGLLGFMPSATPDADDTAKAILTLNLLGENVTADAMIAHFKTSQGHFCTYPGERDASFSANCNVLQAVLSTRDPCEHREHVIAIASFLCKLWWKGEVKDKWNNSSFYSMMLLSKALILLLSLWSEGVIGPIPADLLETQIPVALTQILNRTLCTQLPNGSWGVNPCAEVTAYAVITLKELSALPWVVLAGEEIESAIQTGQAFLAAHHDDWTTPQYLWIEKVTYGNPTLSKAYCLTAMRPLRTDRFRQDRLENLVSIPDDAVKKSTSFMSMLPCFRDVATYKLKISAIEGLLFLPKLKSARADILPRQQHAKNEYLSLIPLTWIVTNNVKDLFLPANLLWDMMILTVCNFRVDEYMETSVTTMDDLSLQRAKGILHDLCAPGSRHTRGTRSGKRPHEDSAIMLNGTGKDFADGESKLGSFKAVIGHYLATMLNYPSLQQASSTDISLYRTRFEEFLVSHIDQIEDNKRFRGQDSWSGSQLTIFETPRTVFPIWLHTTGAASVSALMSFSFFTCLLGDSVRGSLGAEIDGTDCFTTVSQKYLAHDLSARLAALSRLYNDYGSIARDREEANINCVNFAEFRIDDGKTGSTQADEAVLKTRLLTLAEYERRAAESVGGELIKMLEKSGRARDMKIARGLELFLGTTVLYADFYVTKDLSNSIK